MTREEFNDLSIDLQVNYFNSEIEQGHNFNAICKEIGISKNTIRKRFNDNDYFEVKQGQIIKGFAKEGEVIAAIEEAPAPKVQKEPKIKSIALDPKKSLEKKEEPKEDFSYLELVKRLEALEVEVNHIKELGAPANKLEFIPHTFSGLTTTKTFKIDTEVYQELEAMVEKYPMYKKQDIVSSLLRLAIDTIK